MPHALVFSLHQLLGRAGFVESAKGQDLYSLKRQGARGTVEESPEHQELRFYTRECKLEAVRLSETSENTVAQIARDLGVPERVLYRWRHELRELSEQAFPSKGHRSELEEENRRLKRELELLKQEREI